MRYIKPKFVMRDKIAAVKVLLFVALGFGVFSMLGGNTQAISGASTYFPYTSPDGVDDSFALVQITGTGVPNADVYMKARTTIANVYVPRSQEGQNVTITIVNGCHGTTRDSDDVWYGQTYFSVRNINYNNGNGTYGRVEGSVRTDSPGVCSGTPNMSITFNATAVDRNSPLIQHGYTIDNGVTYNVYQFVANAEMIENSSTRRYLNAFALSSTAPVQVGISSYPQFCDAGSYPNSCPTVRTYQGVTASRVYSSFYGPRPASAMASYDQRIIIQSSCQISGGGISFYDLDAGGAANLSNQPNLNIRLFRDGTQVTITSPNGTPFTEIPKAAMVNWESGIPGLLNPHPDNPVFGSVLDSGGNNDEYMDIPGFVGIPDPMFASLGNFQPNVAYELQVNGIDSNNAIQILPNYPLCQEPPLDNVTCSIAGPIRISSSATTLAIPVRINAVSGSAVPAGSRTGGLHLGVAAAGSPSTWNSTANPISPPPDNQSRYVAKSAGSAGLSHYQEPFSGFTYNRYWVNSAIAEGSSGDVTISVDISQIDQDLVVRMLDRAGGRWLANYCSVKINRNSIPSISINGTPDCTNFSGNYRDSDGDRVEVYLLVNGNRVVDVAGSNVAAFNLSNQTSSASDTPYSFDLRSWRDFNARNFQVVVSDGYDTTTTGDQSVGPCLNMACGGATVTPGSLEVNEPFSISVNFIMRYIAGGGNATIGSRGQAVTYNVNLVVAPTPGAAPANPVVGTTTIPASGTNSIFTHNIGGFRASNDPTNYTISYRLNGVNNANATSVPCPTTGETAGVSSSRMPYIQVFRGDVIAGYGVKNNQGICTTNANGGIRARSRTLVGTTELVGSGTQMAVFALGSVQGFRSAITDAASGVNSRPWQRIFANSTEAGNSGVAATDSNFSQNFGGLFDSSLCAENWSEGIPNSATVFTPNPVNGSADIDVSTVFNVVRYNGNVRLNASAPLTGSRKIYVNGNVIIGDAFAVNQQLIYDAGPWGSIFDIPSFTLIATGDIIIDDNITRLDGVFVSGGTVFTCAPTGAALPNRTQNVTQFSPTSFRLGGQCNTIPLSLHGAIVANSIRLWRTGGTLSQSVNGNSTGLQSYVDGLTGAETFRLSPEVFVAPRFGEEPANGSAGKKQLDSLISLPPPF